jgi:hypothetical protein
MTRDTDTHADDLEPGSALESDLRALIAERARVRPEEVEPLRAFVAGLPARRRRRRAGLLAAAAGIVVMLGLGALVVTNLPFGTSGAAPSAPNPAAFDGDPRLAVCNATAADATAIFEMTHLRDYPLHLPAAYPLIGLQGDPEAPTLVIVFKGPGSVERGGETPAPGSHDLCLVVGADPASWQSIAVVGVDTTGLLAYLPEPTGTPIPAALVAWADRCGGQEAGILAVVQLVKGGDHLQPIGLDPDPAELAAAPAGVVVVYDGANPFPPVATPPPGASSPLPRDPLGPGHHDICVLVGTDAATAQRFVHEDVAVILPPLPSGEPAPSNAGPSATTPVPGSPQPQASGLPAQVDPQGCSLLSFATERCLAVVEAARVQASLAWTDIARVVLAKAPADASAGSFPVAAVVFDLRDGSSIAQTVRCGIAGGQYSLVCSDDPQIRLTTPITAGYDDVPCGATPGGQPGSACASPMPTIDPAAAASAQPLAVASLDIPITTTGHLELDVGPATLPNGILSAARFALADPHTRTFAVKDAITLVVRSGDPTRPPFLNLYAHGWYPGTEAVEVYLVLDVTRVSPGALLEIRDLVVK